MTIDEGVNYTLFEPAAKQVYYRVSRGDQLDLVLLDGNQTQIRVSAVDESSIYSENGRVIAIDEIRELHNTYKINLAQGTAALMLYGVAGPLSVLTLPVVIPMLLLYDEDAVKNWQDDRLCRVSEHPDHYGYLVAGFNDTDTSLSVLDQVISEIKTRELHCDAVVRAERYCAYTSERGTSFRECTARQIPNEQSGVVDILAWTDKAVCIALQRLENGQELGDSVNSEAEEFIVEVSAEKLRRDLDCEA